MASSGGSSIIREFLVALGFKVDEAGFKKFDFSVSKATTTVLKLGAIAGTTALAIEQMVSRIADQMNQLGYASQRTNSAVSNLKAFGYAAETVGLSAEEMGGAVEGMAVALRNPGLVAMLNQKWGIKTEGRQATDILIDFLKVIKDMPPILRQQYGEMFNQSDRVVVQLSNNFDKFSESAADLKRRMSEAGDEVDDKNPAWIKFHDTLTKIKSQVSILGDVFAQPLLPYMQSSADWAEKNLERFAAWNKELGGTPGLILGIAGTAAGITTLAEAFSVLAGGKGIGAALGAASSLLTRLTLIGAATTRAILRINLAQ